MAKLSAASIAACYTEAEIRAKITEYQAALDAAAQGGYGLDTTAGNQRVTPPDPVALGQLLESYMKALQIKTGTSSVSVIHVDYRPGKGLER